MTLIIHKQVIPVEDKFTLKLPKHAVIRAVQVQHEQAAIWYEFDANELENTTAREFMIFGTGHPISHEKGFRLHYLGTFQLYGGSFVGHLYELTLY